jgi:hypothetical protein
MYIPSVEYTGESVVTASPKWNPVDFADTIVYGNAMPGNFFLTEKAPAFRDAVLARLVESDTPNKALDLMCNIYRSLPSTKEADLITLTDYAVPFAYSYGELVAVMTFLRRNQKERLGSLTVTTLSAYKNAMDSNRYKKLLAETGNSLNNDWVTQLRLQGLI